MQCISIRKTSLLYSIDTTASPAESPSVTLELRVSIQPAKPDSPVRLLCEELPSVYVFFAHMMFTIFYAPFPNRISHFKILALP